MEVKDHKLIDIGWEYDPLTGPATTTPTASRLRHDTSPPHATSNMQSNVTVYLRLKKVEEN